MKSKDGEKEFVDHMMYIFQAPIIQHPMWPVADKIKDEVTLYRLAEVQTIQDKKATGWEVMGYISSQSLVAPLDHNWYQIYMYLFNKYIPGGAEVIGIEVIELGIQQEQLLDRIQRWMFKNQTQHLKGIEKARLQSGKEAEAMKQKVLDIEFEEVKA